MLIWTLSISCYATAVHAILPTQNRQHIDSGWQFVRGDLGSIWEVWRPVQPGKPQAVPLWQTVRLPHCFNATDACDPDQNYYQGPGWYRALLTLHNPYPGGRTILEFEGAGQKTEVYVYDKHVATHVGGYDEWTVDITEAVAGFDTTALCRGHFGGKIPIAIRCDNSRDVQLIPSDMSDFNLYGGIYRHLNLVYTPCVNLQQIKVTPSLQGKRASIQLDVKLSNSTHKPVRLLGTITSPQGQIVGHFSEQLCDTLYQHMLSIRHPILWSPDTPRLYSCRLQLLVDSDTLNANETFGLRSYLFKPHGPFYLNGKRLLLRGTHRHEDHAGVGAAMSDSMIRHEMRQIKNMGANMIRLGHYQQSNIVLNLCDSLGIMVWEEIPWCRGGLGGDRYRMQAHRMLENMITQHYNHPSIILWGMGNENDWEGDFPTYNSDSVRWFMKSLVRQAHQLDPTRLTVCRRCDFASGVVDVYSPSIWAGWYSRNYRDYYSMAHAAFERFPRFIHAEWGGDSHVGRHEEKIPDHLEAADRNGNWSETYAVKLFDWHLSQQLRMPWLTGSLFWTFKDFSTPLRPRNPIPYVNQKGVVQRDGTPKESYYVFQSYWSTKPMVHIYGHSWPIRWGKSDEQHEVLVYSNCPEVELFVNGHSMGIRHRDTKQFPAAGFHWKVNYKPGSNVVTAVARQGHKILTDEINQQYQVEAWKAPHHLRIWREDNLVKVMVVDDKDRCCLDASQFIRFSASVPDILPFNEGTSTGSRLIQLANGQASIRLLKSPTSCFVTAHLYSELSIPDAVIEIPTTQP